MKCKHCGAEILLDDEGEAYIHKDGYYMCLDNLDTYAEHK